MTTFKANRKFPNPITVNDDPRSHTLALQQVIEALNIGQRRTKEINSSYVRLGELVDVGLIEIVNGQLKLTNTGAAAAAGGATALTDLTDVDLTGLANGDTLVWNSSTSMWEPGSAGGAAFDATDMYDQTLSNLGDVAVYMPRDGDVLTYNASTGLWEADDRPKDPEDFATIFETDFLQGQYGSSASFTQNGSSISDVAVTGDNHPGILRVASITGGASGSAVWQLGTGSVFTNMSTVGVLVPPAAPDYLDYEVIARAPDVLPPTIGEWQLGYTDFSGQAGAASAYLQGKNGALNFLTIRNGTGTTTSVITSAAPADGEWFKLKIRINSSKVLCYINDALVARHTTNIPTTSTRLRPTIFASNNVTATTPAPIIDVDYMRISRSFSTPRLGL